MLKNGARFVGLDAFWHHVEDVMHDGGPELQVVVGLHPLLGHGLGHTLGGTALKVPGEEVSKPALEQRNHTSHEEKPNTPARSPKAAARALANRARIKPVKRRRKKKREGE